MKEERFEQNVAKNCKWYPLLHFIVRLQRLVMIEWTRRKVFGEGKYLVWKGAGTHADRHCEERARMLVSEFVKGQCVSRPTS